MFAAMARRLRSEVRHPARGFRRRRNSIRTRFWNGIRSSSTRSLRPARRIRRVSALEPSFTQPSSMRTTGSSAATRRSSSRTSTLTVSASFLPERRAEQRSSLPRIRLWWRCFPHGRDSWVTVTRLRSRRSATTAETADNHESGASRGAQRSRRPCSPGAGQMASTGPTRRSSEEQRLASGVRFHLPRR